MYTLEFRIAPLHCQSATRLPERTVSTLLASPQGTAEVVFTRKADAMAAVRRYNGVRLDGQAMQIEVKSGPAVAAAGAGRHLASGLR